jgi:hypothetical protein
MTNRDTLEKLMQAAYQTVFNPEVKRVRICVPRHREWQTMQQIPLRDPKSLMYSNGMFDFIHTDTQRFQAFLMPKNWLLDFPKIL